MIADALSLALESIRQHLLRSLLTVLGIVIGVTSVVTMVTLGRGATQSVTTQISTLGSNLVILQPGQRLGPGRDTAGAPAFSVRDAEAIQAQIDGLAAVAPVVGQKVTLVSGSQNWQTTVTGSTNAYLKAAKWTLSAGRSFLDNEILAGSAVCIAGDTVVRELFGGRWQPGAEVRLGRFSCELVGTLQAKGQSAGGQDQDDFLLLPLRTVQRRLTGSSDVAVIFISAAAPDAVASVKSQVELLMLERRRIVAGGTVNFTVQDTRQIAQTLSSTTTILTMLLGAVAAVSLVVGGVGIMNIMLVSVTERTREIGVRLAIGALPRDVLSQFLVEAVLLAALGGLTGVLLALFVCVALAEVIGVPFVFDATINLLAVAAAAGIGVIFGYLPARRAAAMNPVDALRHD